jgi:hypothetical protein
MQGPAHALEPIYAALSRLVHAPAEPLSRSQVTMAATELEKPAVAYQAARSHARAAFLRPAAGQ